MTAVTDTITVDYYLPVTRVHVAGSVVTSTAQDGSFTTYPSTAVVTASSGPDYRYRCALQVPTRAWFDQRFRIGLTPDGRLASTQVPANDQRAEGVRGLGLGVNGAAFGPVLGESGHAGAAAGMALAAVTRPAAARSFVPGAMPEGARWTSLRIDPEYASEHTADAELLYQLRLAQARARVDFARLASEGSAADSAALVSAHRRLDVVRDELARQEHLYQEWLDDHVHVSTTVHDALVEIDKIPRSADALTWLSLGPAFADESERALHALCTALRVVITCDPVPSPRVAGALDGSWPGERRPAEEHEFRAAQLTRGGHPSSVVHFRRVLPVELRTHAVTPNGLVLRSVDRLLVTAPFNEESIDLLDHRDDQSFALGFDESGALVSIGSERPDSAPAAFPEPVSAFPRADFDFGDQYGAVGRARAVHGVVEELAARAKLSPAPEADAANKARLALEQAEYDARLRAVRNLAADRHAVATVVLGG